MREAGREAGRDASAPAGGAGDAPGEARYALLETVRQYGAAVLAGTPDEAVVLRRHAEWIAAMVEGAEPLFWSPARGRTIERLLRDLDDIRAALAWALGPGGDARLGIQIAGALGWLWTTGLPWDEGIRWMRDFVAAGEAAGLGEPGQPTETYAQYARMLMYAGGLMNYIGKADAALAHARHASGLLDRMAADVAAAEAAVAAGTADPATARALPRWTRTLRHARSATNDTLAESHLRLGDAAEAVRYTEMALAETLRLGHPWYLGLERVRRALILSAVGRSAEATAEYAASAAEYRALGERWMLSYTLHGMAGNALTLGHPAAAAAHAAEAAAVLRDEPDPWFLSRALDALGVARAAAPPDADRAADIARLLGAAEELRRRGGVSMLDVDGPPIAAARAAAEAALGPAEFAVRAAEGAGLAVDAMIALAGATARRMQPPADGRDAPAPAPVAVAAAHPPTDAGLADAGLADAAPALQVDALGAFAVRRGGRRVPDDEAPAGKVRELLLWLLLHPQGTKEQIGLALWPDASPAQLRSSFHFTLHHLRRALGDPRWVAFAGNAYRLDRAPAPGARFDADVDAVLAAADALRAAARRQEVPDADALDAHRRALERYRGDLDANTGGGAAAGEWLAGPQQRLRAAWADGTALLGVLTSAAGRHAEAVAAFERVLAAEPLREGVHRALMQAHAAAGEPGRALAHYDALAALLAREVGAAPSRETRAVAEQLRGGPARRPPGVGTLGAHPEPPTFS